MPRRRITTTTSLDLAVLRVLRSAMVPDWSPADATAGARAAIEATGGSVRLLRQARMQLIRRFPPHQTEIGSRALLALTFALVEADEAAHAGDLPLAQ